MQVVGCSWVTTEGVDVGDLAVLLRRGHRTGAAVDPDAGGAVVDQVARAPRLRRSSRARAPRGR